MGVFVCMGVFCVGVCVYVRVFICVGVSVYVRMCECVCLWLCECTHVHMQLQAHLNRDGDFPKERCFLGSVYPGWTTKSTEKAS